MIEVLTELASNACKALLRKPGISYMLAGKTELDSALALSKLQEKFHIETPMLGGGGVLNWSFLQAGKCSEISLVLAAAADGSPDTPPVFRAKTGLSESRALSSPPRKRRSPRTAGRSGRAIRFILNDSQEAFL